MKQPRPGRGGRAAGRCHNKMTQPGRGPLVGLILRRGLLLPLLACVLDAQRVRQGLPADRCHAYTSKRNNMTRKH